MGEQNRRDQWIAFNVAPAHFYLDEIDLAIETLEESLRERGPLQSQLSSLLFEYVAERSRRSRGAGPSPDSEGE